MHLLISFSTFVFHLKEISILQKCLHFAAAPSILQIIKKKKKIAAFHLNIFCRTELIHQLKCIVCCHGTFAGPQSYVLRRHFIVPVHGSVTLFIMLVETSYRACINCFSVVNGKFCTVCPQQSSSCLYVYGMSRNMLRTATKKNCVFSSSQ